MSPLLYFQSIVNTVEQECFNLAKKADLFLQVDESGRIWLGDGKQDECFRVNGWFMTYKKINEIIRERESK